MPSEWARRWEMGWRSGGACADAGSRTAVVHVGGLGGWTLFLRVVAAGLWGVCTVSYAKLEKSIRAFLMLRFLNARN